MLQMKKLSLLLVFLILFSSFTVAVDIGYGEGKAVYIGGNNIYGLLKGDNTWTGTNIFNNFTWINYTSFNVTGNTTATDFCFQDGSCVSSTISELNDSLITNHNELDNLEWSNAGHIMDDDLDMNQYDILDVDDMVVNGTFRNGIDGNMFVYDTDDEIHHLNADLERWDELRANVFTNALNVNTIHNITGDYINISSVDGNDITFILQQGTSALSERFNYNEIILELTAGTEQTPILNRVYAAYSGGVPTWFVSITEPTTSHAMVARILMGDTGEVPYAASLQEDGASGFLKRVQRVNRKQGLLYEKGFDYNSSENELSIGEGSFINGIYDSTITDLMNTSTGFYVIHIDGSYHWYTSFDDIDYYSDGNLIGNNRYYNVLFGITPYDGHGNIYVVVQSEPNTEYTSVIDAYADNDNTLKIYPSEEFLKTFFLPVARMIIQKGDTAKILPNGDYAEDYRGGVAGGSTSGGGLSEADPIWTADKVNYLTSTESNNTYITLSGDNANQNINLQGYNITNATNVPNWYYNVTGDEWIMGYVGDLI